MNITPCDSIISDLETHSSRINKEQILEAAAKENNVVLFEGMRMALDKLYTFGVKQVPLHHGTDGSGLSWDMFVELADLLYNRKLTGHAARDAIKQAMETSTVREWNYWYRRILIKDLRCGVSEKTVNKVLKGFPNIKPVPVFECMLANDGANHEKKIAGKKLLEPKLDGVRVLTVINSVNQTVVQFTRNGKVLENFSHIVHALEKNIDLFERSWVLDGEMISSDFQTLMKQVHRKENVQAQDARLVLFDIIPLSEFLTGQSVMGQKRRSNLLRSMKPLFDQVGFIEVIDQKEIDLDTLTGELEFAQFNEDAIKQGYEGILVKNPNAVYECKRTTSWLKIKPVLSVDLAVVAVEEGTGKNVNKLGALICEGTDAGNKFIRVNVGSGFTDEQRDEIWLDKDAIIGQIVEVKADCVTQSQDNDEVWSLRFPRFERFRGFKAGDKF